MQKSPGPVDKSASAESRDEVTQLTITSPIVKASPMPALRCLTPEWPSEIATQRLKESLEINVNSFAGQAPSSSSDFVEAIHESAARIKKLFP